MDAIDLLIGDHNRVRGLFAQFKAAHESDDVPAAAEAVDKAIADLEAHTTIEEEIFYPETRELSDEIEETTAEGIEEHHVVKVLIAEIRQQDVGSEVWAAKVQVMIENVEHHAEEEETELFPKIRSHSSADFRSELGARLESRKQELGAPTSADAEGASKETLLELARDQEIPGRSTMDLDELAATVDARSLA